ncbi:MAG: response regulator [Pseudomonadota bacterium]|nr:response regulator [Pseudomonadota bacterium]
MVVASECQPGAGRTAERPQRLAPGGLKGLRVLIAEDEPILSLLLEEMLSELGCRVSRAVTKVAQALEVLAADTFDVALFDLKLHDESIEPAADVCLARGIPLVFATGYSPSGLAQRFSSFPVIEKPYTLDDLQRALLNAVAPRG